MAGDDANKVLMVAVIADFMPAHTDYSKTAEEAGVAKDGIKQQALDSSC